MKINDHQKLTAFVLPVFFLSGGCALVYEVLWTRYLAHLMGGTSQSELVVLMVFMGGLSAGAILTGRLVDRSFNGLRLYGLLEMGIGAYAVLFPVLFKLTSSAFQFVGSNLEPGSLALYLLKMVTAVSLITLPALAMGGTLPAITRYLTRSYYGIRRNFSILYAINSLGAVAGILAGGFYLVYRYGMGDSMIILGVINLFLGGAAFAASRFFVQENELAQADEAQEKHRRQEESRDAILYDPPSSRRAIVVAGISGFAAMALQVAWIRYFAIVLGATHSAFTIVVAAFIFGLGLGALLVRSRYVASLPLPTVLSGVFALTSLVIGLGLFGYARAPFEISRVLAIIAPSAFSWPFYLVMKFSICFVLMLLPTLASGMILPVCVRIAGRGNDSIGRDVALVYTVNTLGALLGILITGQVFFRLLNLPRTFQVILFIYLVTTGFLAFFMKEKGRKRILAVAVALFFVHISFWKPWPPEFLHASILELNLQNSEANYAGFIEYNRPRKLVEDRLGPDVQVTVQDIYEGNRTYRTMFINGKPDASNELNGPDMTTQVLLGHVPMLLHPSPQSVFVLGVGSGITSGEILKFPEVKKVITAELAVEVFEASKTFSVDNNRYWENPKHRIVLDDGKTFLQLRKEKFDVISLEPTNVWQEGMAGLFSEEFFELVKSRLADGGVVAQWLHTFGVDDVTFNIILKTFSKSFPDASIFEVGGGDVLLVGYQKNWKFNPYSFEKRFYLSDVIASQRKVGIANPVSLLMREVMGRDSFRQYTDVLGGPVNTDDFPVLEQTAEFARFVQKEMTLLTGYDSRVDPDIKDLLIHSYFNRVGLDKAQLKSAADGMDSEEKTKLRESLNFKLLDEQLASSQVRPSQAQVNSIVDQQLRGIISHPLYSTAPEAMTANDAYNMLGAELLIWGKAASQFWTPDPGRLEQLFRRFEVEVDQITASRTARNVAVSLARGEACQQAMKFFRIAEAKGGLSPDSMEPLEIVMTFYCEAKVGDPQKALSWWKIIEKMEIPVAEDMKMEKAGLDIKLRGLQRISRGRP